MRAYQSGRAEVKDEKGKPGPHVAAQTAGGAEGMRL
jgi:hypothetical protein